jgi:hypothetical protein
LNCAGNCAGNSLHGTEILTLQAQDSAAKQQEDDRGKHDELGGKENGHRWRRRGIPDQINLPIFLNTHRPNFDISIIGTVRSTPF